MKRKILGTKQGLRYVEHRVFHMDGSFLRWDHSIPSWMHHDIPVNLAKPVLTLEFNITHAVHLQGFTTGKAMLPVEMFLRYGMVVSCKVPV